MRPDVVIGHSVGEYAALAAADSVTPAEVMRLVRVRGLAMAGSQAQGAMAAVLGLDDDEVERLCAEATDVWPANYNCPGQVVISGREEGVAASATPPASWARKVIRLRVSGAFHSPLMADAANRAWSRPCAPCTSASCRPASCPPCPASWRRPIGCPACCSSS